MPYKIKNVHLQFLETDPRYKKLRAKKEASGLVWEAFILKEAGIEQE